MGKNSIKYFDINDFNIFCFIWYIFIISRSEKADIIRYYIELEKILIKYANNIANDLYNQLEIKSTSKKTTKKL